jgi:hypothetical protein
MRIRRSSALLLFSALLAMAACDPKLTGTEGGGGGDDDDDEVAQITNEARAVGQVIALHFDLMKVALQHSASYDTASVAAPRSIFPTSCITVSTIDADGPVMEMLLDECVAANGTDYSGRVGMEPPLDGSDGYVVYPYTGDFGLVAVNESQPFYSHYYTQGTLELSFSRDGTSGEVNAVDIGNFLRHNILTTVASFTYLDIHYAGSPGDFPEWPGADGTIQVSWDGVGVFTVELSGGSAATFTLQGKNYLLNLSTGEVSFPPS